MMNAQPTTVSSFGSLGSDIVLGGGGADRLTGSDGSDWLIGREGGDWIEADAGDDGLDGGAGSDWLDGGDGDDVLVGGDGNDILSPGAGSNTIQGGGGSDQIDLQGQNIVSGGEGADRYRLYDFADAVANPNIIRDFEVGYGGDILDLASAIERVDPRNDTEYPWLLDPVQPFTSGLVRVVASGSHTLVQVNLEWIGKGQGYGTVLWLENVAPEQLSAYNFRPAHHPLGQGSSAIGTDGNDTLTGSLDDDMLSGLGGHDSIQGSDGEDWISGGDGDDTLFGGLGADTILGGAGDDSIHGDPFFWGGDHWSPAPKPGGADVIDGGDGNDTFYEWRGGSNTINGGAGDDVFHYVSSQSDWTGHEFYPDEAVDRLTGGQGRDTYLIGYSANSPADVITDFATGAGGDILDVSGLLAGLPDYVKGTNPFLTGQLVLEQSGTSTVVKALIRPYFGAEAQLQPILTLENTRVGDLTPDNIVPPYDPSGTFGAVKGTALADILDGSMYPELLEGLDGDDTVRGHNGDDRVEGGAGNDRLEGGAGADTVYGGIGEDRASGGGGNDTLYGGDGNDRLQGDNGNDMLDGGWGDDLIMEVEGHHALGVNDDYVWGGAGSDTIYAGAGNDYVDGGQSDDILVGGTGDDLLFDSWGSNRIDAGSGNDTISSVSDNNPGSYTDASMQPGVDTIVGGAGADRYILFFTPTRAMVADRVLDFEAGAGGDVIDVSIITPRLPGYEAGSDPFAAGLLRLTQGDGDVLLQAKLAAGFSTILVLENSSPELILPGNFDWMA
jgi:Ca2+-binding RTX toxin-like protein